MVEVNRLYLVRHGENPANLTKEFSCRKVDYSLTEKGRLQAEQTGRFLASVRFDALWTSPLRRAHETALAIARHQDAPLQIHDDFREMDVGDLEGLQPLAAAWDLYAQTMRHWLGGNFDHRFPSGESRTELLARFRRALEAVTHGRSNQTLLVVGHGGLFTHGVAHLCRVPDERAFFAHENHNCSVSILDAVHEHGASRLELVDWASVSHLSGEAARVIESVPESFRAKNL